MDYIYDILNINETEHWITISSNDEWIYEEPDSFIAFVKRIREKVKGNIEDIGQCRYKIENDGLGLIYQWDEVFGISVIYPAEVAKDEAVSFLEQFFVQ